MRVAPDFFPSGAMQIRGTKWTSRNLHASQKHFDNSKKDADLQSQGSRHEIFCNCTTKCSGRHAKCFDSPPPHPGYPCSLLSSGLGACIFLQGLQIWNPHTDRHRSGTMKVKSRTRQTGTVTLDNKIERYCDNAHASHICSLCRTRTILCSEPDVNIYS